MTAFQDIKSDYDEFSRRAQSTWQPYFTNSQVALKAYAGRSWTDLEVEKLRLENRSAQEYNIIRPKIQLYSGFARDNIKSTIVGPVETADQKTADELSEVMRFVYEKGEGNSILLNGFDDCLKTGVSLVGLWIDFSNDPVNGDIKFYKRSFNSFLMDPDWQRLDMSDVSEISLRDFVTREDAKALLPFVDPKVIDEVPSFSQDNKFTLLRRNTNFLRNRDVLAYDQYYRKVSRRVKEIVNVDTGIALDFNGDSSEESFVKEKIEFAKQFGINAELIERDKQFVELNIILSGEVVYSGPDPLGLEDYPFV